MKRIILCLSLFAFFGSQAQQINPVPDYVFRNQMSVGRNAVTDTAAYISIGPRYGANKGLMPPIVSDTAAITGVKRNGLLIFSVQRNNFQYWDSINSRWTSVTANVDTTIISTRAWRKKGDDSLGAVIATRTDTTLLSTRAWRQKGLDSLAAIELNVADTATMLNPYTRGSGTVNYVPKFTTTRTLGNSLIFDNGTNVGIGTTSPVNIASATGLTINGSGASFLTLQRSAVNALLLGAEASSSDIYEQRTAFMRFGTSNTERLRIFANGRVGVNTTTDAGYQLDINGTLRSVNGANFATDGTSHIGMGTVPSAWSWPNGVTQFRFGGHIAVANNSFLQLGTNSYYDGSNYVRVNAGYSSRYTQNDGGHFWATAITSTAGSTVTFNEQMRMTRDGELLINTTTDVGDYRLQVNGNANFRDDVLIDSNARVNQHITLNATPKAWALGNAIQGPDAGRIFMTSGELQLFANVYYDGSYKYLANERAGAIFLLKNSINFVNYDSSGANTSLTGAKDMKFINGELQIGLADQGTFKLQVADKSYFGDEVQIASTTDLGNYKLQVTGEAIITAGIRTDAPSGGTAATWKLGTVATVTPTSPNRTIEVEIGGTTYYIHAKTTND